MVEAGGELVVTGAVLLLSVWIVGAAGLGVAVVGAADAGVAKPTAATPLAASALVERVAPSLLRLPGFVAVIMGAGCLALAGSGSSGLAV